MGVTVISIVIGALGTVPKDMEERMVELEIRESMETIYTTALLRRPEY